MLLPPPSFSPKMAKVEILMLVANGKTERHSELPTSEFELDFCIRHQHPCELTCSHLLVPSMESPPRGIVAIPILSEDSPRFFLRGFLSALLEPESQDAKTNQ